MGEGSLWSPVTFDLMAIKRARMMLYEKGIIMAVIWIPNTATRDFVVFSGAFCSFSYM